MSSWQPAASLELLRDRALLLTKIRRFFADREVLEVETPLLSRAANPDAAIDSIKAELHSNPGSRSESCFLQTSPEFFMKRLLAAGSGSIYQVCRAFRDGECGRLHNPEFSMLEWYRTGFDMEALIDEVDLLMRELLPEQKEPAERVDWHWLFEQTTGMNLQTASNDDLRTLADRYGIVQSGDSGDDGLVEVLFDLATEAWMHERKGVIVRHFPADQASLAMLSPENPALALRFEYYYAGVELANGFQELADSNEQNHRFEVENSKRERAGKAPLPIDRNFIEALSQGLPECSGVAVGIDRILMMRNGLDSLETVMPFPLSHI